MRCRPGMVAQIESRGDAGESQILEVKPQGLEPFPDARLIRGAAAVGPQPGGVEGADPLRGNGRGAAPARAGRTEWRGRARWRSRAGARARAPVTRAQIRPR